MSAHQIPESFRCASVFVRMRTYAFSTNVQRLYFSLVLLTAPTTVTSAFKTERILVRSISAETTSSIAFSDTQANLCHFRTLNGRVVVYSAGVSVEVCVDLFIEQWIRDLYLLVPRCICSDEKYFGTKSSRALGKHSVLPRCYIPFLDDCLPFLSFHPTMRLKHFEEFIRDLVFPLTLQFSLPILPLLS